MVAEGVFKEFGDVVDDIIGFADAFATGGCSREIEKGLENVFAGTGVGRVGSPGGDD